MTLGDTDGERSLSIEDFWSNHDCVNLTPIKWTFFIITTMVKCYKKKLLFKTNSQRGFSSFSPSASRVNKCMRKHLHALFLFFSTWSPFPNLGIHFHLFFSYLILSVVLEQASVRMVLEANPKLFKVFMDPPIWTFFPKAFVQKRPLSCQQSVQSWYCQGKVAQLSSVKYSLVPLTFL